MKSSSESRGYQSTSPLLLCLPTTNETGEKNKERTEAEDKASGREVRGRTEGE